MKGTGGWSLIELLVALFIVAILSTIAYFGFGVYSAYAVRAQMLSDIRNCLTLIAIGLSEGNEDIQSIVSSCPRSEYTQSIELVSQNPITLTATSLSRFGEVRCTYNENVGNVTCDGPF